MCETCEEPRWSTWLLFNCSNYENHPEDAEIGIAVITNQERSALITSTMSERICTVCGSEFSPVTEESALTPYLTHDIDRFKSSGYAIMKDVEIVGEY